MFLINHIDKIIGKGLSLSVIIELILTNIASMVVMAAPMSVLVSTLMAFGGLATDREYTAASAAGVSPFRLIRPVAVLGLLLAMATAWFSNEILPDLNYRAGNLFLDIRRAKPGFELKENTFYDGIRGYTFIARRFGAKQDTLYDVTLFQEPTGYKKEAVIDAKYAFLESDAGGELLTMRLHDGHIRRFFLTRPDNDFTIERSSFAQHRISFDISELSFSKGTGQRNRSERSTRAQEMQVISDSLASAISSSTESFLEINRSIISPNQVKDSVAQIYAAKIPKSITPNQVAPLTSELFLARIDTLNPTPPTDSLLLAFSVLKDDGQISSVVSAALNGTNALVNTIYDMQTNIEWKERKKASYDVEIFKKMSIPLACFLFVFIGAGIGLYTKHGNIGYAAVVSTFILTYYWIATLQGEKLADRLIIDAWLGTWFADISIAVAAIILLLALQQPWKSWRFLDDQKSILKPLNEPAK